MNFEQAKEQLIKNAVGSYDIATSVLHVIHISYTKNVDNLLARTCSCRVTLCKH